MTEKELLYVEDAIMHEKSIISLCNEFLLNVYNDDYKNFFNNQISSHEDLLNNLTELLKEKANE